VVGARHGESAMELATLGAPVLLGKHPSRGDFVAFGLRGPETTGFDDFVTASIEWAEARAGAGWDAAYGAGGVQAFVYRPETGSRTVLVGAFAPSTDRAGRRYPLSFAIPLQPSPALLAAPGLWPILLEPIWSAASEAVLALVADPQADIAAHLTALAPPQLEPAANVQEYLEWTQGLPADELWALLFGAEPGVDPAALLGLVTEAVMTVRGIEAPTTPLSLRLPLGAAGGAAVCFWLDWVCSVARWRETLPSFFWSHDGERGALLLCLGKPPRCTLAELWLPTRSRDVLLDVATDPASVPPPASGSGALAAAWTSLHTVADVLEAARTLEL
jgi:type VI secretion system ImpM family protein